MTRQQKHKLTKLFQSYIAVSHTSFLIILFLIPKRENRNNPKKNLMKIIVVFNIKLTINIQLNNSMSAVKFLLCTILLNAKTQS